MKRNLFISSFKTILCFITFAFSILLTNNSFTQTTYTWIGATGGSWATSTNWSPTRTTPATNDIIQFNDGNTYTITAIPAQTIRQLLVTGNSNITLQSSGTTILTVNGPTLTNNIVIASGSTLQISATNALTITMTTTASQRADISGTLNVRAGTFTTSGVGTNLFTVSSTGVVNHYGGTITASAATLSFSADATYNYLGTAALTIPTSTWDAASNINITGITSTATTIGGTAQSFGNVTYNCTGQGSVAVTFAATSSTRFKGNFNLLSTGSGTLSWKNGTTAAYSIYIDGNLNVSGGTLYANIGASYGLTVYVIGNFNIDGGTFNLSTAAIACALYIDGDYNQTGGTFTQTSSTLSNVYFRGTGKSYTKSSGTMTNTYLNYTINTAGASLTLNNIFTIPSGRTFTLTNGTLTLPNGIYIDGAGTFTTNSTTGTLVIKDPAGITSSGASGNIQTTTRTYGASTNYTYNGSAIQVTGNGLATANNLTIDNIAGVTLSGNVTVSNLLTLTNGNFNLDAYQLTLNGPAIQGTATNLQSGTTSKMAFGPNTNVNAGLFIPSSITNLSLLTINTSSTNSVLVNSNITLVSSPGLTLTSGMLVLGDNDIILSNSATGAISGGSTNSFVITNGTGQLIRATSGAVTYAFPVGDNDGTAEYSPVSLVFTANATARNIGVVVSDIKHPNNSTTTDFISRYWTFTDNQEGVGTYTYTPTFTYLAADITGNYANMLLNRYNSGWSQYAGAGGTTTITPSSALTETTGALDGSDFTAMANANVYIWAATSGSANFATPSSWEPQRNTPLSTDILQFSKGGTVTATGITTQTIRQLIITGNTDVTLQASVAAALNISGSTGETNFSITDGSNLTLGGGTGILTLAFTTTAGQIADIAGGLYIANYSAFSSSIATTTVNISGTLGFNGATSSTYNTTNTITTITGTLQNNTGLATMTTAAASLTFGATGIYNHNLNGGTIPTATWNTSSNCNIIGIQATNPTGFGQTFGNLTWNTLGQTATGVLDAAPTINGNLTLTQGTMNFNAKTVIVKGNVVNDGTIITTTASSVLNMNGTTNQSISGSGTWIANINGALLNLTINNSGGGVDLQIPLIIYTGLTLTAGDLTQSGDGALTLGAGASTTLTITRTNGTLSATPDYNLLGTYNVTYGVSSVSNFTGNELPPTSEGRMLGTLTISNTVSGGTKLGSDADINALTISASSTFDLNNNKIGIATAYSNSGTLNASAASSTVSLDGTTAWSFTVGTYTSTLLSNLVITNINSSTGSTVSSALTVSNVTVNSGAYLTIGNVLTVKNDIINNGNIINTTAQTSIAINMNGTTAQTISGSGIWAVGGVSPLLQGLTINNSSGGVDLQMPLGIYTALTLTNGVLSASGDGALTMGAGISSTLTVTRTAGSVNIDPTWNLSGVTLNVVYGTGTTVSFTTGYEIPDAATSAITGAFTLNTTATGTVTLNKDITVNGTWTNTTGLFSIGANTLTLNGAVTMTAGSWIGGANSQIIFGGTGTAALVMNNVTPGTTNLLKTLTINRSSGITTITTTALIVSDELNLTNGTLTATAGLTINGVVNTVTGTINGGGALVLGGSSDAIGTINLTSGAATFASLTFNNSSTAGTTAAPTITFTGNLTLSNTTAALYMNGNASGGGVLKVNGNLIFSTAAATFNLTSGMVYMGNNTVTYTNNVATAANLISSFNSAGTSGKSYFAFIGSSGGFVLNQTTAALNASLSLVFPIGPAGDITGFRPFTITTNATTNIVIGEIIKIGFINHSGGTTYSPTNIPITDETPNDNIRAGFITNITLSGTIGTTGPNITMTYLTGTPSNDFTVNSGNSGPTSAANVKIWQYNGYWINQSQTSNGTAGSNTTIVKNSFPLTSAGTYALNLGETNNDAVVTNTWTWIGGTSNAWATAANWSPNTVPNATTANVIISNPGAIFQPVIANAATYNVNNISISTGCSLTLGIASSALTINGTFTNNGTLTADGFATTITYAGTGAQIIQPGNYSTLISSNTGDRALASSGTIGVKVLFTAGTNTYTSVSGSTVQFNGTQSFTRSSGFTFNNLIIATGNLTLGASTPININGDLNIATGTSLIDATNLITGPGTGSGNFNNNGTLTLTNTSTTDDTGNYYSFPKFGTYTFSPTSTVNFNGAAAQNIYPIAAPGYGNLSTTTGALANAKTAGGSFTIQGNLNVGSTTSAFYDGGYTITINGNITNTAGIICGTGSGVAGTGKILMSSANAQSITGTGVQLGNLEIDNSNASGVAFSGTASALLNVYGYITITNGLLTMGNFTTGVTVAGNLTVGDGTNTTTLTFNGATGTKTFNGNVEVKSNGTLNATAVAAVITYGGATITNNGTFNTSLSTGTTTLATNAKTIIGSNPLTFGALTVSIATEITSGTTVNVNSTFNVGSTLTNNGYLYSNSTAAAIGGAGTILNNEDAILSVANTSITPTLTPSANTNLIIYTSTAAQTVKSTTYYNLTIDKSSGTATMTTGGITVNGDLTIENGTLATSTLTLTGPGSSSSKTFTINNSGVFNMLTNIDSPMPLFETYIFSPTSTVAYLTDRAQNILATTYGNLTLNNNGGTTARIKTALGSLTIIGNFANSSSYITFAFGSSFTHTFNGMITNSGTFSNTANPNGSSVIITGNATTTMPAVTNGINNLTMNGSGTITLNANTIYNALTINSGTIKSGGSVIVTTSLVMNDGFYDIASQSLTVNGTITNGSGPAKFMSSTNAGTLTLSGSGGGDIGTVNLKDGTQQFGYLTFSRSGAIPSATIEGNLTLAAAAASSFNLSSTSGTLTINGNLTVSSNTASAFAMTGSGSLLNMNGNLTLSATSVAIFNWTNGIINMGDNTFTYNSTGANIPASTATKYISFIGSNGGFQWNMPASTAASTYRLPIGISGAVTGFRPLTIQTTATNPASIVSIKAGFINHTNNDAVSETEVPLTDNNRAGYILRLTYSGAALTSNPHLTMAYQDGDFNDGAPTSSAVALYRYAGTEWARLGNSAVSSADGNVTIQKTSVPLNSGTDSYVLGVTGGSNLPGNTYVWKGTTSTAWNDPTNWDLDNGMFPNDAADNVIIDNTYTPSNWPVIPNSVTYSVRNLSLSSGSLTIGGGTSGQLDVYGSFTNSATITCAAGSTVRFASTGSQTIPAASYVNLTVGVNGGATTIANGTTVNVSGTFTVSAALTNNGTLNSTGTAAIAGSGAITNGDDAIFSLANASITGNLIPSANSNTVIYNGTAAQTIKVPTTNPYYNLTIDKTSNTATMGGAFTVSGDLTIENGTLATSTYLLTGPGAATGSFLINNTGTFTSANTSVSITSTNIGPFPIFQNNSFSTESTISLTASAATPVPALTYGNLTLSGTSVTKTAQGNITVMGTFTNNSSVTFAFGSNFTHTFNAMLTNGGTLSNTASPNQSSLIFSGSGAASLPAITNGIKDLNIDRTGGTITMTGANALSGVLTLTNGILSLNGQTLTLNGTIAAAGSGTISGTTASAITIGGTGDLGTLNFTTGAQTLLNFTVNRTSSGSVTLGTNLNIGTASAGALTLTNGIVNTGSNLITIANTGTGGISGGSSSSYVNGPLARTLPASLVSGSTYNFPIGKSAYQLISMINPITTAGGTVIITTEAFDEDAGGTPGVGILSINTNRYWSASVSGAGSISSIGSLALTETGLVNGTHIIGQSATKTGIYQYKGGTVAGSVITSQSSPTSSLGYFVIGTKNITDLCPGPYTIGPTGDFGSIADVANLLNGATVSCNLLFELQASYTEAPGTSIIFTNITNGTNTITFRPAADATNLVTAGDPGTGNSLINFSGADYIIFDGRAGGTGSTINWTVQNTRTASTVGPAIQFTAGANYNILEYLNIQSSNSQTSSGTILFYCSNSSPSNVDNTYDIIRNCDIGPNGSNYPANAICAYAYGLSLSDSYGNNYISILDNDIHDFIGSTTRGVLVTGSNTYGNYGDNWTITGNSFYRTVNSLNDGSVVAINFLPSQTGSGTSSGNTISNNFIGGNASARAGGAIVGTWVTAANTSNSNSFMGIQVEAKDADIDNNVIGGIFDCMISNQSGFCGIDILVGCDGGTINVRGNTIGSNYGAGNLYFTTSATSNSIGTGSKTFTVAAGLPYIAGDRIRISTQAAQSSYYSWFMEGSVTSYTGTSLVVNVDRILGSGTIAAWNINIASGIQNGGQFMMEGIWAGGSGATTGQAKICNITNNIIGNLANTNGNCFVTAGIITQNGGPYTITGNTIFNLTNQIAISTSQLYTNNYGSIVGISQQSIYSGTTHTVSNNTVYNLYSNYASTNANAIYGIELCGTQSAGITHIADANFVHSISSHNSSTASIHYGIFTRSGNQLLTNNMVRLGIRSDGTSITGSAQLNGIYDGSSGSSSQTIKTYHNSVFIGGTGVVSGTVATYAFRRSNINSSPKTLQDIRNNIFVNNRSNSSGTAKHYSIGFDSNNNLSSSIEDYNVCYGSGATYHLSVVNTTDCDTYTALRTTTGNSLFDANSAIGDPNFIDPTAATPDLHIQSPPVKTPVEGAGTDLATTDNDYDGDVRADYTPVDIGADAGDYLGNDRTAPSITYTALSNTSSLSNAALSAIISDASGVDANPGTKPRIYFKRTYEANIFNDNTNITNGWKYTEASNSSSPFTFSVDYSLLYNSDSNPVAAGDYIQYFVIAQDLSSDGINVGINSGTFNIPASVTSVDDYNNIFPLGGSINQYWILPSQGTYTVGGAGRPSTNYTTLTGAEGFFLGMNDANTLISNNIVMNVTADITEPGTNGLNQWTESGAGNYTLIIQPDAGSLRTISATALAAGSPMININGADRVSFDGNYSGSGQYLLFRNTNATVANCGAVIQFNNNSVNCNLNNCILESNATTATYGQVILGATGTNATIGITENLFRDATGGTTGNPANAIYSNNANNNAITISNNSISNFTGTGVLFTAIGNTNIISGNSFFNNKTPNTAQTSISIANTASNGNTISGNYIGGQSANCGGTAWTNSGSGIVFIGINLNVGTSTPTSVQNNTIQNINLTGGGATSFDGIKITAGNVNVGTVIGNTIGHSSTSGSITNAGTTTTNAITSSSTGTVTIANNLIANLLANQGGTLVVLKGINMTAGASTSVIANTIRDLNAYSTNAAPLYGIYATPASGSNTISQNTIYSISNLNLSNSSSLFGLHYSGPATGTNLIAKNVIHSINSLSTNTAATLFGINIAAGNANIQNNIIRLGINAAGADITTAFGIKGISDAGGTNNYYFNSVYIGGIGLSGTTISTYAFYSAVASGTRAIKNNIFVNARSGGITGYHYAYRTGALSGLSSDYNIYYTTGSQSKLFNNAGADYTTLQAFRNAMTNQDLHSTTGDPNFVNPTGSAETVNLKLSGSTPAESAGTDISGITDDFEGDIRATNTPIDIGADAGNYTAVDIFTPVVTVSSVSQQAPCGGNLSIPITATITDIGTGLASGANSPKLWWRLNTDTWNSLSVSSVDGNNYYYTLELTGVVTGQTYQYYVAAQDQASTPNIGYSSFDANSPVHTDVNTYPSTINGNPSSFITLSAEPLSGSVTVGTGGDYSTFNGASGLFAAINSSGLSGDLTVNVISNITETTSTPLNSINYYCAAGPFTITIVPSSASLKIITGSLTGTGLFAFNGANRITIDGRFDGAGKYLKFANTNTTSSAGPVIYFYGNASNNTVEYCELEGQGLNTGQGIISIGTSASSSASYITIDNNNIYGGTNWATNLIYSAGLASAPNNNITISNNNLYNFKYTSGGTGTRSYAIYVTSTGNGSNWTISGNSIYNKAANSANVQTAISFLPGSSSSGNIISGNYIGGSAPLCGSQGSSPYYWNNTYSSSSATVELIGIDVNAGSVEIAGNTIKRIRVSCAYNSGYKVIQINGSTNANINNNIIGGTFLADFDTNPSNADLIQTDGGAASGYTGYIYGILAQNSSNLTADHNTFNILVQNGVYGGWVECITFNASGTAIITNNDNAQLHQETWGTYGNMWSNAIRLQPTASSSGHIISNNNVRTIAINGGGIDQYPSFGIYVNITNNLTVSGTISNNKIVDSYSVENSGVIEGIFINTQNGNSSSNGVWNIINNMIYLQNPDQPTIRTEIEGIDIQLNSASTANVYYNTVWIDGISRNHTTTFANPSSALLNIAGPSGSAGTMNVRNNVFINTRQGGSPNADGYHVAVWHDPNSSSGWNSDNNLMMFRTGSTYGRLAIWRLNAMYNLSTWQSYSGGDNNSYQSNWTSSSSDFSSNNLNPNNLFIDYANVDLHVNISDGQSYKFFENRGTPISIITDFDVEARCPESGCPGGATNPDIGADEFISECLPVVVATSPSNPVPVCAGAGIANITVTVNGTAPYNFQWQIKNGSWTNLTNGGIYGSTAVTTGSGLSTNTLTITNPDATLNNKQYRCIIINCLGLNSATSTAATLSVNSMPDLITQPISQEICYGDEVNFITTASDGLTYQWLENDEIITGGTNYSGYNSTNLTINNVAGLNGNIYSCVVSNANCTLTTTAATLTVTAPQTPSLKNFGGTNQLAFNNAYISSSQPIFRVSSNYSLAPTFNAFKIDISSSSTFSSVNWTQTFSGSYDSGVEYDLTFTNISGAVNGTTYYVRAWASCDGGNNWTNATTNMWSFIYNSALTDVEWRQQSGPQFSTWTANTGCTANASSITMTSSPINRFSNPGFESSGSWNIYTDVSFSTNLAQTGWSYEGSKSMSASNSTTSYSAGSYVILQQAIDLTNVTSITGYQKNVTSNSISPGSFSGGYGYATLKIYIGGNSGDISGTSYGNYGMTGYGPSDYGISTGNISYTGTQYVKFVWYFNTNVTMSGGGWFNWFIDDMKAIVIPANASFTTQPIYLASFKGASDWGTLKWNQTLNGGGISWKIQSSTDGNIWNDVSGLTNITATGNGNVTPVNISAAGSVDMIRLVATLSSGQTATPVINSFGVTANTCVPPSITAYSPVSKLNSLCEGSSTYYELTTTGSDLTYQWYVSDNQIDWSSLNNVAPYSGVTTAKLDITNTPDVLNGKYYRCIITGACSPPATSDNMSIVVSTPPAITADPSPDTKCEGLEAQFSITATGSGTLTYQWQENGVNITGMGTQSVYSNYNTETLDISDVTGLNSNQYRCVISGLCPVPASSENALLTVIDYPTITGTTPGSRCGEGTVDLSATASEGDIKWYDAETDGNLLYTGTNWTTPSLNVSKTYYLEVVHNGCISVSRTAIKATIKTDANITFNPADAMVKLGGTTSFSIATVGEGLTYQWQLFNDPDWNNIIDGGSDPHYAGATTNILIISQATEAINNSEYRCIVSSDCSTALTSGIATLTVNVTPTSGLWIGGTAGPPATNPYDWNIGSNWEDGNVPNSATDVIIPGSAIYQPIVYSTVTALCNDIEIRSRASLYVEGSFTAGGNLRIKSDATGTGAFANNNSAVITISGTATVERYLSNNGYHYISTPINSATYNQIHDDVTLKNLTGAHYDPDHLPTAAKMPNVWVLDEEHTHDIQYDQNAWKAPNGLDDVIGEMQGVALVVPNSDITLDIEGDGSNLNKGNKSYTLTKTALSTDTDHNNIKINVYGKSDENGIDYGDGPGNGWHIIGNPYPSPVDWDAVQAGGGIGSNISHTITFFKATSLYAGAYGYYNPLIGPSGSFFPSQYISSMQSFYLHNMRITPGSDNLSFKNSYRNVSNEALGSPFYKKNTARKAPANMTLLRFNVNNKEQTDNSFIEETVIGFSKDAEPGFDINYDAEKLFNTDENIPNLFTRIDKMNMAVNVLPEITEDLVIPLGFKAEKTGKYSINISSIENLPQGIKVYLNDMKLNTVQELTTDKEYSFTYELTDQTSRFYLSFTMNTNTISEISREMFYTYTNNKYLYINFNSEKGNTGLLEVFNAEGQKIIDGETISSGTFKFAIDEAKGIYIVRLITNKKVYTNRVFIE